MPDKLRVLEAAILAARGLQQEEIAYALGCTQGTVSRRLKEARKLGFIEVNPPPQLQLSNLDYELLRQADYNVNSGRLRDELWRRLNGLAGTTLIQSITIEPTATRGVDRGDWEQRLHAVCRVAAQALPELLSRATVVAVAWGYTLRFIADDLKARRPLQVVDPPTVIPVVGTFPHTGQAAQYPITLTSSRIASDLAESLNGKVPQDQVGLAAIPAYIPVEFEYVRDQLLEFYSKFPGFREVFRGRTRSPEKYPEALLFNIDMLVTGVGAMPTRGSEGSPSLKERLRNEKASLDEWAEISVGDISGVLIPAPGINKYKSEKVEDINRRFIGPGLQDLKDIAQRCVDSGGEKPGVVVIAHDRSKARAVIQAVRLRCINRLFIDLDLANEIERLLDQEDAA